MINGQKRQLKNRFVVTYSEKRAHKDQRDRERLIEKSMKYQANPNLLKQDMKKGEKTLRLSIPKD